MKSHWKTLSSKIIYKNKFLSFYKNNVIQPDGKQAEYPIIKRRKAVVVVPIEKNGTTYLVRQYRYTLKRDSVELPAGYIEDNETPLQAAKRELAEEVGLKAKNWKKIGEMYMTGSIFNGTHVYFVATGFKKVRVAPDSTEEITIEKIPIRKVLQMISEQKFDICSSAVAILMADNLLREGQI